jgi:hypothetical protein
MPGNEYVGFAQAAENSRTPAVAAVNTFFSIVEPTGYSYTGAYVDATDLGVVETGLTLDKRDGRRAAHPLSEPQAQCRLRPFQFTSFGTRATPLMQL